MKPREALQLIPLAIALVLMLIPLYFIHSAMVDRLAELSVYMAKGVFKLFGLPQ